MLCKANQLRNRILFFIAVIIITFIQPAFAQWEKTNFPINPPLHIFQFESGLYAVNYRSLYKSTDDGLNWSLVTDFNFFGLSDIEEIGDMFIATTHVSATWPDTMARVFRSDDGGQTWDSLYCAVYGGDSIEKLNSKLFMSLDGHLFCSADTGKSWTQLNTSDYFTEKIYEVIVSGNLLYVKVEVQQLFRSDDEGLSWTPVLSVDYDDHFFYVDIKDSIIFVGTYEAGCLKSKNNGLSWERVNSGLPESSGFRELSFCKDFVIGAVSKDLYLTVYKMNCNDTIWYNFNDGLNLAQTASIHDFECNNDYLFMGSDSSLWRRPISELITSVNKNDITIIPKEFNLRSFPNPFNSSTTIRFNLESRSHIQLKIYDVLGREVKTLFDGILDSGDKCFHWNASEASSGIYIVRLSSTNQFETTKLILLK